MALFEAHVLVKLLEERAITSADLQEIKLAHSPDQHYSCLSESAEVPWCNNCYEPWPCTPALLVAHIERLEQENVQMRPVFLWADKMRSMEEGK